MFPITTPSTNLYLPSSIHVNIMLYYIRFPPPPSLLHTSESINGVNRGINRLNDPEGDYLATTAAPRCLYTLPPKPYSLTKPHALPNSAQPGKPKGSQPETGLLVRHVNLAARRDSLAESPARLVSGKARDFWQGIGRAGVRHNRCTEGFDTIGASWVVGFAGNSDWGRGL